jgi:pre-mRNA-splicing factor CDC5/CEF1
MREARNLRNMTAAQTPLLGEANTPLLRGTGAVGATPRQAVTATPNPLLTPAPGRGALDVSSATPRTDVGSTVADGRTPLRTPFRDNLGLNSEDGASVMDTPRDAKRALAAQRRELQAGLRSLPAPKNDFELVLDEPEEDAPEDPAAGAVQLSEEDAAERDARIARQKEADRLRVLARRSQVVQRGLPRPANVDLSSMQALLHALPVLDESDTFERAQRLIDEEMVVLIQHDSIEHPLRGSKAPGGSRSAMPELPDDALAAARSLVHSELAKSMGFPGASAEVLKRLTASSLDATTDEGVARLESFEAALAKQRDGVAWSAEEQAWVDKASLDDGALVRGYEARLAAARKAMGTSAAAAAKDEKRLGKLLGGYQARSAALSTQLRESATALAEAQIEHEAFARLAQDEEPAVLERTERLRLEVQALERSEASAQLRYREMDTRRRDLLAQVEALQTELDMREAERINDAALAANEAAEALEAAAAKTETGEADMPPTKLERHSSDENGMSDAA